MFNGIVTDKLIPEHSTRHIPLVIKKKENSDEKIPITKTQFKSYANMNCWAQIWRITIKFTEKNMFSRLTTYFRSQQHRFVEGSQISYIAVKYTPKKNHIKKCKRKIYYALYQFFHFPGAITQIKNIFLSLTEYEIFLETFLLFPNVKTKVLSNYSKLLRFKIVKWNAVNKDVGQ